MREKFLPNLRKGVAFDVGIHLFSQMCPFQTRCCNVCAGTSYLFYGGFGVLIDAEDCT